MEAGLGEQCQPGKPLGESCEMPTETSCRKLQSQPCFEAATVWNLPCHLVYLWEQGLRGPMKAALLGTVTRNSSHDRAM